MRARRWQFIISVLLTIGIIVLAYLKRDRIALALESLREARPSWLLLAIVLELFAFFLASQVYDRVLRSLGYRLNVLRLWAIALVAIILSQSVPAGGVATYAFLVQSFKRRGIPAGHSTLVATLEALSYAGAMLLLFGFSLGYLALRTGLDATEDARASLIAAGVAIATIGVATFVLTREQEVLTRWLLAVKNGVARLLRRNWSDEPIHKLVDELARGRALIAARPVELAVLVLIQLAALIVHSLAMLVVLHSLGADTSLFVVMAAFGLALITSTFNVLPGGGGTVEAVLVLTLTQSGVEAQAYVAALIFRIINFWMLLPIAAICYRLLNHDTDSSTPPDAPARREIQTPLARD
ncbi:MAG TPA: lysylphosphatidylglycerol synthase transmembrane domain-containing protein [Roseiflexaceae bacterium]|nr:lysylphosphatidylglycerol synthase transmembrane domain-containing protein [Roseiflexaceae bacterium]